MHILRKFLRFGLNVWKEAQKNQLPELALALTYRLVFACAPFLIFLMSIVGSFKIDAAFAARALTEALPENVAGGLSLFLTEAVRGRNGGVLSVSLLVSVFSAANGFKAIIKGVNAAYGEPETRGFIRLWLTSAALVLLLAAAIIVTMLLFIFGDKIYAALATHIQDAPAARLLFGFAGGAGAMFILLCSVISIYRVAACGKQPIKDTLPGAALVVGFWLLSSKLFNLYVNNFSRYSSLYGGVAGIFILMLWLNMISTVILIGAQINALLFRRDVV